MSVILETTLGDITVDLFTAERPRTCLNFLKLCKIKYYNYCLIHSIQRNFMVQTGDPLGTGRGGESIFCKLYGDQAKFFEAEGVPKIRHVNIGTVSMVNNGENMHGSQFFITTGEDLDYLDGVHTIFGQVVEGLDVLKKINDAICDEDNCPYKDIRISHTVVLDDPYNDPDGMEVPPSSPEPTDEQLRTDRIGVEEEMEDTRGKTIEEIEEEIEDKEAKARATILEMVGDLPEADVKPPDNVLFVCKLNPVTTEEDLEVIFSRFGPIISCEVIKDRKSGESLQYAFIEFEKEEDCENAFFKMDNVLIDDRRIHVDFSQSVSKMNYYPRKQSGGKKAGQPSGANDKRGTDKLVVKGRDDQQRGYEMVFQEDSRAELSQELAKLKDSKKTKKLRSQVSSNSDSDDSCRPHRRHRATESLVDRRRESHRKKNGRQRSRSRSSDRRRARDDNDDDSAKDRRKTRQPRQDSVERYRSSDRSVLSSDRGDRRMQSSDRGDRRDKCGGHRRHSACDSDGSGGRSARRRRR